ncbi:MAG: hypothetical protein HYY52_02480 [Candidatus Melainabacteria bacterium]|nr:hypothetical protein [Candidatus Melainabacteria bacterium]
MKELFTKLFYFIIAVVSTLLFYFFYSGPVIADTNAKYINSDYIQEGGEKTNCELNGAWTTEYNNYYWLPEPTRTQKSLPPLVKEITYTGVTKETNSVDINTPESLIHKRNNFYLSSSLKGESITITQELENSSEYSEWIPLSIYFDPTVTNNSEQLVKISLSYAHSSLGNIVYVQNTSFNLGCYLNLIVKSPLRGQIGRLTIEIKPASNAYASLSGIFWGKQKELSNLKVSYHGSEEISAPIWYQSKRNVVIWSPESDTSKISIRVTLGKISYTTSTGFEFPLGRDRTYNFKVLQGQKGLEFYLGTEQDLCSGGCELGLYFTEKHKQFISIYSANIDKKNILLAKTETNGNGTPLFEKFYIEPNDDVSLRVRINTNIKDSTSILRGLYLIPRQNNSSQIVTDAYGNQYINLSSTNDVTPNITPSLAVSTFTSTIEETPKSSPIPEPTPEPTPESTIIPDSELTSIESSPIPEPIPEPTPEPTPESTIIPNSEPASIEPSPIPESTPEPTPESTIISDSEPASIESSPTLESTPELGPTDGAGSSNQQKDDQQLANYTVQQADDIFLPNILLQNALPNATQVSTVLPNGTQIPDALPNATPNQPGNSHHQAEDHHQPRNGHHLAEGVDE